MNTIGDTARIVMFAAMFTVIAFSALNWIRSKPSKEEQKKKLKEALLAAFLVPAIFLGFFYVIFRGFLRY